MIAYSRPKRSDLYTLCQSKLLENHTLYSGTYLYGPYMAVPPPGIKEEQFKIERNKSCFGQQRYFKQLSFFVVIVLQSNFCLHLCNGNVSSMPNTRVPGNQFSKQKVC